MKKLILTLILSGTGLASWADVVEQWSFNTPDAVMDYNTATGTLRPYVGSGYPAEACGGVGNRIGVVASGANTDPNTWDNSQWRLGTNLGNDSFPIATNANKTVGAQFRVNTSGFGNLRVTWDQENSATASRYWRVQYTTDGVLWQDHSAVITALDDAGHTNTPPWQTGLSADFSALAGVNDNPNFGFRIVSEFEVTATGLGTNAYVATRPTNSYGTGGTLWLDMVTVTGDNLNPNDQAPQISSSEDQVTLNGLATPALAFTIADAETASSGLILSASSSNPSLVNKLAIGGSDANRTLVATPEAGQTGTAIITIAVKDEAGKITQSSFQLTVTVPTLSTIPVQMTTWDSPVTVSFTITNLPGDPSTWLLAGSSSAKTVVADSGIVFNGTGTTRTLTLTPVSNATGETLITVTASTGDWQATTNFLVKLLPGYVVKYDFSNIANTTALTSWPVTTAAAGLSVSDLTRGPGIMASGLTHGFAANRWNGPSSTNNPSTPSRANAIARGDYYQFTVAVGTSMTASLVTLDASLRRSAANAPLNFEWQYSLDGFATAGVTIVPQGPIWTQLGWSQTYFQYQGRTSGTAPATVTPYDWVIKDVPGRLDTTTTPGDAIPTIDLSTISNLQNINGPKAVTFRLYGWGNASTADSNTTSLGRMNGPSVRGTVVATPVNNITLQAPVVSPASVKVNFSAASNASYSVLRAPAVTGPWSPIGTANTDGSGSGSYLDNTPLATSAFYRVSNP